MHTRTAIKLFALSAATLAAYGCSGLDTSEGSSSTTSNLNNGFNNQSSNDGTDARGFQADGQSFGNLTTVRKTPAAMPAALQISPVNGQLFPNQRTRGLSVHFQGFTTAAGETVDVQVLSSPGATIAEANWVSIGTATSSATGTSFNDTAQIFAWSLDAVPNPNGSTWDQGGILRYRTVATDAKGNKSALPFWDIGAGDCVAAQGAKSWKDVVKTCKSAFSPNIGDALSSATTAATLLSPTPQPRDNFQPNYLSRRGEISQFETDNYYDVIDAPRSLDEFANRFGFFDSQRDGFFDASQDGNSVASGLYYNLGDLGLGREIHCKQFTTNDGQPGTACITKNYGVDQNNKADFSGDAESAMGDAVRNQNSFAAVCMVKIGNTFGPAQGNDVQFMVYGADGNIVDQAQLDSTGSNESIPNNCLNCHGGSYDRDTSTVSGSSFLPYDPESFLFDDRDGFSYEAQEDTFRQLNAMVKASGAPPGTVQFVNGIYGNNAEVAGTKANLDWIPTGWSGSEEAKTVYNQAYKHYCRTCHTSQIGDFAFMTFQDFLGTAQKTQDDVCHISEMPVCEGTMQQFWQSSARAYIVNSLGVSDSCTPGFQQQQGFQQ